MVVTTLPPAGSRPVMRSDSLRTNSRSSVPLKHLVGGPLERGLAVHGRQEAGDRREHLALRVLAREAQPAVPLDALREDLPARDDLPALTRYSSICERWLRGRPGTGRP